MHRRISKKDWNGLEGGLEGLCCLERLGPFWFPLLLLLYMNYPITHVINEMHVHEGGGALFLTCTKKVHHRSTFMEFELWPYLFFQFADDDKRKNQKMVMLCSLVFSLSFFFLLF